MYALVDCNSFFASCEKVFRPDLRGKAVVVLSNNDGCVVARTAEAKKLGIPMGEAFFKIKRFVETGRVIAFSGNYALYNDMSHRVMRALEQWTPNIEIYSIDEAFIDLSGLGIPDLADYCRYISKTVFQWTGIPVSVGIAPTKTLAKVANETAKSRGIDSLAILNENIRVDILKEFDIDDVWGVGRRLIKPLRNLGLRTAYDLSRVDPLWMRKKYSIVQEKTVRELSGEACFGLDFPETKKNILVSRSFAETTDSLEVLQNAVAAFAARAAEKCRHQNTLATAVHVHANTSWFRKEDYFSKRAIVPLTVPSASTPEIIVAAFEALDQVYRPHTQFKRVGVMLLNLVDAEAARSQGYLFEMDEVRNTEKRESERKLMESLDRINGRFGRGTVFFGAEGVQKKWKQNRNMVSPAFVSKIDELPIAYAK